MSYKGEIKIIPPKRKQLRDFSDWENKQTNKQKTLLLGLKRRQGSLSVQPLPSKSLLHILYGCVQNCECTQCQRGLTCTEDLLFPNLWTREYFLLLVKQN